MRAVPRHVGGPDPGGQRAVHIMRQACGKRTFEFRSDQAPKMFNRYARHFENLEPRGGLDPMTNPPPGTMKDARLIETRDPAAQAEAVHQGDPGDARRLQMRLVLRRHPAQRHDRAPHHGRPVRARPPVPAQPQVLPGGVPCRDHERGRGAGGGGTPRTGRRDRFHPEPTARMRPLGAYCSCRPRRTGTPTSSWPPPS
jgi:hypothetical protein